MTTAVLSLGSNIGDSRAYLLRAIDSLGPVVQAASSLYRTPPWGPVAQDDFLNMVVIVADPQRHADDWLDLAHELEQAAQRERLVHWGPRTLDVDVIAVWERSQDGDETTGDAIPVISADPKLTLPHPHAAQRAFVLLPWAEIAPDAQLPGYGAVADLLADLDTGDIHLLDH